MKIKHILFGAILIWWAFQPGPGLGGESLKITQWEPMGGPPAPAYIHLSTEFPCDLKKPRETIRVNGRPAAFTRLGGGFGGGVCLQDYAVYVGTPGIKEITVTLSAGDRTLTASTSLEFRSQGAIVLLDRVDGQAVWAPEEWRFWVYFVKDVKIFFQHNPSSAARNGVKDVKITVNDQEQPAQLAPAPVSEHHFVLTCRPDLRPGSNTITLAGTNLEGREIKAQYHTYYARDRQVKVNDEILLPYGYWGSKSGPFFRLEVEGEAVAPVGGVDRDQSGLKDGAWFFMERKILKRLRALRPGTVTLRFLEKKWFTEPFQLRRTDQLTVVP